MFQFSHIVYRGDQCYNMNDCGRFSMIYMLSALEGQDPITLPTKRVYLGFKRWIEGKSGLLRYQRSTCSEIDIKIEAESRKLSAEYEGKRAEKIRELLAENQSRNKEYQEISDEQNQIQQRRALIISRHNVYADELRKELSEAELKVLTEVKKQIDRDSLQIKADQAQLEARSKAFNEKPLITTYTLDKEYEELQKQIALSIREGAPVKQSWISWFGGPIRGLVDVTLRLSLLLGR
ncbi:MAG: hypothetical protein Q8K36_03795 [Alphaproteobacteria bacterium]|nr:hypothetical protein [Alphaproteobacteria bacterium]